MSTKRPDTTMISFPHNDTMYFALPALYLYTADDHSLGKIDYSLMPPQAKLEIVVDGLRCVDVFKDCDGSFLDFNEWNGIFTDRKGMPTRIDWEAIAIHQEGGTIQLDWLPETIQEFLCSLNGVRGTVTTKMLPLELQVFDVHTNALSGKFAIEDSPRGLTSIIINDNEFEGSLTLLSLPPKLEHLCASANKFSGSLDLGSLPQTLETLFLDDNAFYGGITLENIPSKMMYMNFKGNKLSQGTLKVGLIPPSLVYVDLVGNVIDSVESVDSSDVPSEELIRLR